MGVLDSERKNRAAGMVALLAISFAFSLNAAPQIVGFGPSVRYVGVHGTYSFHVTAYGGHLVYQWWNQEIDADDGHPIPPSFGPSVNSPRLVVTDAQNTRDYNGWYWCVVSNKVTGATAVSPRGQVFVIDPPTIVQNPLSQSVPARSRVSFSVEADPHGPVRQKYQWHFNGQPMPGAVYKTLVIVSAGPRRQGAYSCRVTTIGGSTMTGGAVLMVQ